MFITRNTISPKHYATPATANVPTPQPRIKDLIQRFLADQDVSQTTKDSYTRTLKQYLEWVENSGYRLADITHSHILQYKNFQMLSGKTSLTVGTYLNSVRRFYQWAEANKLYPNIAKGVKTPPRVQKFRKQPLTPPQAKKLLEYAQGDNLRNFALINLLLRTGLRTIEASRANIEDITYKGGQRVLLVHGKGRAEKDNFVILTDKTYQPILKYLQSKDAQNGPIFTSTSNNNLGQRIQSGTISSIVKNALNAIGLIGKEYTAHSLRHTTAVSILRSGGSIEQAQFTLRHSNPATTQIYTHTLDEERRLADSGEALIDELY